jgi:hypothetical protein
MNAKEKVPHPVPLPVASIIVVKVTRRVVNEHLMDQEYVIFVLFKTWTLPADRVQMTVTVMLHSGLKLLPTHYL